MPSGLWRSQCILDELCGEKVHAPLQLYARIWPIQNDVDGLHLFTHVRSWEAEGWRQGGCEGGAARVLTTSDKESGVGFLTLVHVRLRCCHSSIESPVHASFMWSQMHLRAIILYYNIWSLSSDIHFVVQSSLHLTDSKVMTVTCSVYPTFMNPMSKMCILAYT